MKRCGVTRKETTEWMEYKKTKTVGHGRKAAENSTVDHSNAVTN